MATQINSVKPQFVRQSVRQSVKEFTLSICYFTALLLPIEFEFRGSETTTVQSNGINQIIQKGDINTLALKFGCGDQIACKYAEFVAYVELDWIYMKNII